MVSRMSVTSSFNSVVSKRATGAAFSSSRGSPMRRTSRINARSSRFAELLDDAAHAPHRFLEHGADALERHRALAVGAAGGVVRDHGDGCVLQADLARERRF